ncbi:unnamed protein product [Paramecium sonneborni]|uniref:R3H domain-containing protein n=1 Tax=Paramecium sonneborni TaxID=65129 RepID=A0A8S1K744_9CILI|nr:unnamed protein product [Paramecium sonneborni]
MIQQKSKVYQSFDQFCELQQKWIKQEHEEEQKFIQLISSELNHTQIIQLGYGLGKLKLVKTKMTFGNRQVLVFEQQQIKTEEIKEDQIKQFSEIKQENFRLKQGDQVGIYIWSKVLNQQKFKNPDAVGVIDRYRKNLRIILEQNCKIPDDNSIYGICLQENQVTYKRHIQVIEDLKQQYEKMPIIQILFGDEQEQKIKKNTKEGIQFQGDTILQLNQQQQIAVENAMNQPHISLIHGPPGTGKTRTVCEYIKQAVLVQNQKVLACANSNVAVDNMIERIQSISQLKVCRIGNPARMTDQVRYVCIDQLVKKTSSYAIMKTIKTEIQQIEKKLSRQERREGADLRDQLKQKKREYYEQQQLAYEEAIQDCQVIFSTNVGSGQFQFSQLTRNIKFDVVVIDECAQSLEISCWIPILKGKKVVLAGDHCQLPPTVKTKNTGLEMTLFERIENELNINTQLTVQYRMNKSIMQWSSQEFYNGHLIADESVANRYVSETILLFVDTASCEFYEQQQESLLCFDDQNKSKYNTGEAGLVQIISEELISLGVQKQDIGIITPYNAQVQLLKSQINDIEISTVDGFQGREKDCIIISMVRSNQIGEVGFLSESRRMNVAITRAKKFVCLIGDSETVSKDPFLKRLIDYFNENGDQRSAQYYQYNDKIQIPILVKQIQKESVLDKNKKTKTQIKQLKQNNNNQILNQQVQDNFIEQQQEQNTISQNEILIINFLNSKEIELIFKDQNSFQRKELHELAEKYQLNHESIGNNKQKKILKLTKNLQVQKQQHADLDQKDTINQQEQENKITQLIKEDENKQQEQLQQNQQLQQQQQQQQKQQQQQQEQQQKQQSQNGQQQNEKQKPSQQQQKKKEKQPSQQQQNKKQTLKQQKQEEDEFFDQIVLKDEKKCSFMSNNVQCHQPINLLSIKCKFCEYLFCTHHVFAENHGCGDNASKFARQQFQSNQLNTETSRAALQAKIADSMKKREKKQKKK